ncbi:MAG TPA: PE family protein [Mycobacterium sp.]
MSFLTKPPELLAALNPTGGVVLAAARMSRLIAAQFANHAQTCQMITAQTAVIRGRFAVRLTAGADIDTAQLIAAQLTVRG